MGSNGSIGSNGGNQSTKVHYNTEGFELFLDSEVDPSAEAASAEGAGDDEAAAAAAELAATKALEAAAKVSKVRPDLLCF